MSKNKKVKDQSQTVDDSLQSKPTNELIQRGKVTKMNQGVANVEVDLDIGVSITAYIGGKLLKNRIRVLEGDIVTVELSPYDLKRGRIVLRHKKGDLK
jgi:translation initiation factor IF-1